MKINKISIILGLCLLPVLACAQDKTKVVTELNESGVTFTIPDMVLDSADIATIQQGIDKKVKKIETRNKFTNQLNKQISEKCPNITNEQVKQLSKNMAEYMMLHKMTVLPIDMQCNEKSLFDLRVLYQRDEGFEWYDWYVEVFDINTGKYVTVYKGEVDNEIKTFKELESTGNCPYKKNQCQNKQNNESTTDNGNIVRDDKYVYTLTIHNTYDDDYGMYYYSEWKITKSLISTGKVVAETDFNEGSGEFSTFKELKAQRDFGPVKRCKLAQEVFQIMDQQEAR